MVAESRDSIVMLNLVSPPTSLLSPADAIGIYEARRLCLSNQAERRNSSAARLPRDATQDDPPNPAHSPSSVDRHSRNAHEGFGVPHLTRTPWELERYKRHSVWKRTTKEYVYPPQTFKKLPREVYDCVVEHLEQLHLGQDQSCSSCYLKDLYHLSLTSRAWDRAATLQMYRKVFVANDDHPKSPKLKITGASRLKLLRRTLRERKVLARMVRELHVPDFQTIYHNATIEREEIINLVASLVMACPNLERLVGFHVPYTHSFDRLSHALSTRPQLKEKLWYLADNDMEADEDEDDDPTRRYYHAACDSAETFLNLNSNHPGLTTLVLHQEPAQNGSKLTFRAIIGTLRQFPTLRHLSLSGLSSVSFSNITLNALPPYLQSLRLENLPGINDKGLQRFASSRAATLLESLTLINLGITQIATISGFLCSRLALLKRFTLTQHRVPTLPSGADVPAFEGPMLTYIHWELRSQAGPPPTLHSPFSTVTQPTFPFLNDEPISCLATSLLASSIEDGNFPSLCTIRAPHDPQGVLQGLCKPLATALIPSDASIFTALPRLAKQSPPIIRASVYSRSDLASTISLKEFLSTTAPGRTDSAMSSPTFAAPMSFDNGGLYKRPVETPLTTTLSPTRSRLAAQSRILAARKQPLMEFKVTDPTGDLRVDKAISAYLGDVKSHISYVLRPDKSRMVAGGSGWDDEDEDEMANQWITGVGDVVGDSEGGKGRGYGGCRHLVGEASGRRAVEVEELF
ncbi:hypothetical protein K458DRAFT_386050 [Lentithecium fluviatile CBS 122367]|uniref:F-box domain-containing protein n=1 Tax=Lentithecium fluviatile CBS 122367 TaxID=1168545 RepID=A0A6G1JAN7_9PLEO|nr:hypothetical protein K458DRAFT_386050 [Lentithecium fluviatile CBS 122367]